MTTLRDRLDTKAGRNLFGALIAMTGDRDHRSWFDQVKAIEVEAAEARWGDGDAGEAAVRADLDVELLDSVQYVIVWPGQSINSATGQTLGYDEIAVNGVHRQSLAELVETATARGLSLRLASADEAQAFRLAARRVPSESCRSRGGANRIDYCVTHDAEWPTGHEFCDRITFPDIAAIQGCVSEGCDLPAGHAGDHGFRPFIPGFSR